MTFDEAKEELKDYIIDTRPEENGDLHSLSPEYLDWAIGDDTITLDGEFDIKTLEAIVIYMKTVKRIMEWNKLK